MSVLTSIVSSMRVGSEVIFDFAPPLSAATAPRTGLPNDCELDVREQRLPAELLRSRVAHTRPQANWICRCAAFGTEENECAILQGSHRWAPNPEPNASGKSACLRWYPFEQCSGLSDTRISPSAGPMVEESLKARFTPPSGKPILWRTWPMSSGKTVRLILASTASKI